MCSILLDQQWDGDLLLAAGDIRLRAHSAYLRCLSPKLTDLLATVSCCSSCRSTSVVHFDETSPAGLRTFVYLLYKGEVKEPLSQVLEAYDLAKVFGLNVSIEQKRSSSHIEKNDVGTAEKEKFWAGNSLKTLNAENKKSRKVNSSTGKKDAKRNRGEILTAEESKVNGNICQVGETAGEKEGTSTGQDDERREELEDARNGAQGQSQVEQDEASVETVEFAVVDQEDHGRMLDNQGSHAIIDLTENHSMEETKKELAVISGVRVNNYQGKVSGIDGNDVLQAVKEKPADPRYKFCERCMRRKKIPHHKCYMLCDACQQYKGKKCFHWVRGDEGIRVCDSCRRKARREIEAEPQTQGLEVQVRRSLRKSTQKSTADVELRGKAVNAVEEMPTQVPRHMHCSVCEEFRGKESFKGQSGEGGVKVCDQCRKRRDTEVKEVAHSPQGYKYCDICVESVLSSSFKRPRREFVRSVCNPCIETVEAEAEALGLQGCLFPKLP